AKVKAPAAVLSYKRSGRQRLGREAGPTDGGGERSRRAASRPASPGAAGPRIEQRRRERIMADAGATIAGFGFCTDEVRPDLSGLDDQLARIEATGASHCELSLYELDLIVGGRVLPERRRLLERICARRALEYTVHGVLTVNFMDEAHLDLHKA